ncbi:MAG: GatB/YqeY domain-containing protein [Myxococcales bacterium]|nr:GatB/YqeY domain-containing protein [Myxococcales bacterium]
MLFDEIKKRMMAAMKAGNVVEKEVLRTAIGELTKTGKDVDDAAVVSVLRKLVGSNRETIGLSTDGTQKETLQKEIEILQGFLPATLSVDAIVAALEPVKEAIRSAKNDGQAFGAASKHLKSIDASVETDSVKAAIAIVRG